MSQQQKTTQSQDQQWTGTRARGLEGNRRPAEELQGELPQVAQFLRLPSEDPGAVRWRYVDERIRQAIRRQDLTAEEQAEIRSDLRRFANPRHLWWRKVALISAAIFAVLAAAAALYASGWIRVPRPAMGYHPAQKAIDGTGGRDRCSFLL